MFQKYSKLVCNGFLLIALVLVLAVFLLNFVNPKLPDLRCAKDGSIDEPNLSFKFNGDTISTSMLIFIMVAIPLFQILVTEAFVGSNDLLHHGSRWKLIFLRAAHCYKDYAYGVLAVLLLNDIGKSTINAPRPHWLESCKPVYAKENCVQGWLTKYECSNDEISRWKLADGHKSFPSGHSALSFYAAFFMAMYQHRRLWRGGLGSLFVLWLHLLWFGFAISCTLSRAADHRHHPQDIAFGGLLGSLVALFAGLVLCRGFRTRRFGGGTAKPGGASILEKSFPQVVTTTTLPPTLNGGVKDKRPSLRRLLSTQSTVTQMSDIAEDRELDDL